MMTECGASVRRPDRGGYVLLELAMAVVLLLAALSLVVKVLSWVGGERRAADRRLWAVQEVSNVLETLSGEPYGKLSKERVEQLTRVRHAAEVLPEADWRVEVTEDAAGAAPAKRVTLGLRWRTRSGEWSAPVRVTSWYFRGRARS